MAVLSQVLWSSLFNEGTTGQGLLLGIGSEAPEPVLVEGEAPLGRLGKLDGGVIWTLFYGRCVWGPRVPVRLEEVSAWHSTAPKRHPTVPSWLQFLMQSGCSQVI